jgi:SAM-dependent methyltransferase
MSESQTKNSRFATVDEVMLPEYLAITRAMSQIHERYALPDHTELNAARYPWANPLLGKPALYGSRMWEYPYAVLTAGLEPGMKCADVGCGMSAFTVYLKEVAGCEVVGVDPDVFESGVKFVSFGVSKEYLDRTGIRFVKSGLEKIDLPSDSFDRVFCLSVIEHLPHEGVREGAKELGRILKPGGLAIVTIDVNLLSNFGRPLDVLWESGLSPYGVLDLRWPRRRLGTFADGKQPADVYGLVLIKENYPVDAEYSEIVGGETRVIAASAIPFARKQFGIDTYPPPPKRPLWRRCAGRVKRAVRVLVTGQT